MENLTYNLIVRPPSDHNITNYWPTIQELAREYGIQGPVILANTNQVTVVDLTKGPLEAKICNGRPYSQIPQVIKDYEAVLNKQVQQDG